MDSAISQRIDVLAFYMGSDVTQGFHIRARKTKPILPKQLQSGQKPRQAWDYMTSFANNHARKSLRKNN